MTRNDYNDIKNKFEKYISIWQTKNTNDIASLFDEHIEFYTSTSLYMPDSSQNSRSGIRDFIVDFPKVKSICTSINNFVCRFNNDKAYSYSEVLCNLTDDEKYFQCVFLIGFKWSLINDEWTIVLGKQEMVSLKSNMTEQIEEAWHIETKLDGRLPLIFAEAESPWVLGKDNDFFNDEEKSEETIYKFIYGYEHNMFTQCMDSLSDSYNSHTSKASGEAKTNYIKQLKYNRQLVRIPTIPLKITKFEKIEDRMIVYADLVADLDNISEDVENVSYGKYIYELIKEDNGFKIIYMKHYHGRFD